VDLDADRIMGNSLIFATAYGSTAVNRAHDGPTINIRDERIIMNPVGISEPAVCITPRVLNSNRVIEVETRSKDKRPLMLCFDSFGVIENENKSSIHKATISLAHDRIANLVLADDPGTRAFAALRPR
jgi:NAD kinase